MAKVKVTVTSSTKQNDNSAVLGARTLNVHVLGFNYMSTLVGHFVSSPREREKIDIRDSRGDKRGGQGRKRNKNESEETEK